MKRTTIFLPEGLERDLQAEARRRGQPMASVVREALAEYVAASRQGGAVLSFVGCGAGRDSEGAERHEELLWREPHPPSPSKAKPRRATRKLR